MIRRLGLANLDGGEERLTMSQIENLSHCQFMIGIEQDDLIGQTALRQRVGKSGTHSAGATIATFRGFHLSLI